MQVDAFSACLTGLAQGGRKIATNGKNDRAIAMIAKSITVTMNTVKVMEKQAEANRATKAFL